MINDLIAKTKDSKEALMKLNIVRNIGATTDKKPNISGIASNRTLKNPDFTLIRANSKESIGVRVSL